MSPRALIATSLPFGDTPYTCYLETSALKSKVSPDVADMFDTKSHPVQCENIP